MKKYFVSLSSLALIGCSVLMPSCKKDDKNTPENRASMLIGTWTVVQTAHDDNKNGSPDAAELKTVDVSNRNTETFHSGGTGTLTIKNPDIDTSFSFNWSLVSNDSYLEIVIPGTSVTTVKINNLTASDLQVENNQNPDGADWTYLKKQ